MNESELIPPNPAVPAEVIREQLPAVQLETPFTANEPVAGNDVHAKGMVHQSEQFVPSVERKKNSEVEQKEIEVPEKGDVFVKPGTSERIIVEGLRKEGNDTIVQFSYESRVPTVDENGIPALVDVRKEPGKNFHQLPVENFAVLVHENGGYSEHKPIYRERLNQTAEEFGEIWNASQELLVKVLAQGDNEEDSDEVDEEKNRVIELLQKIGNLEDEWDALGEDDSRKKYAGALALLKQSKRLVGELPESLVVSNSLLRKIQKEYGAKDDDVVEEGSVRKGKMKKNKRLERRKLTEREDRKMQTGAPVSGQISVQGAEGRARAIDPGAEEARAELSDGRRNKGDRQPRQRRDEESLDLEAQGARELSAREIWQGFQKYRGARYSAERWWRDRRNTLEQRIHEIRMQQQDITQMAELIDKLSKRRDWGKAMWRLGPEVQRIALRKTGDGVTRDLNLMEERKQRVLFKPVDFRKDAEELRFLYDYFFRYLAALQVGERVIASKLSPSRRRGSRGISPVEEGSNEAVVVESEAESVATELAISQVVGQSLGDRWFERAERVQLEVIEGLRKLMSQKDVDVAEAQVFLAQYGYSSEHQLAIIVSQLSKGFNPAVATVLESGDLPSTPEAIESLTVGLLGQQQLKRLSYDQSKS